MQQVGESKVRERTGRDARKKKVGGKRHLDETLADEVVVSLLVVDIALAVLELLVLFGLPHAEQQADDMRRSKQQDRNKARLLLVAQRLQLLVDWANRRDEER